MNKHYAIILAGGSGNRLKKATPKAFLKLNQLYILEYSLLSFSKNFHIDHIILVVPQDYIGICQDLIKEKNYKKYSTVLAGGISRFESSQIAINSIKEEHARVLIHDAARPFVSQDIIDKCVEALKNVEAVNTIAPIADSIIKFKNGSIEKMIDRKNYRITQTPQAFRLSTIKKAQQQVNTSYLEDVTDDFNLVLANKSARTSWVEGNTLNFKITYESDLLIAESIAKDLEQ